MQSANNIFTATRIARALEREPRTLQRALARVAPSGLITVQGNAARAWTFSALPGEIQKRLESEAERRGFRNAEHLLNERAESVKESRSAEVHPDCYAYAAKLQKALVPSLARMDDAGMSRAGMSRAELERVGVQDYARVFGETITPRYFRKLLKRTLDRDAGAKNWDKQETFFPENRVKHWWGWRSAKEQPEFETLASYLEVCGKVPTEIEVRGIWTAAFEEYSRLVREGDSPKRAARRVREYLFLKASFLAPTREALLKAFCRKLSAWIESGHDAKALRDGRENNGARFEMPEEDRDLLIHRAVFYYRGDLASAWRDLLHKGFSEPVRERYAEQAQSKSHVPGSVRNSVSAEVEILTVMHQGPRAFDSIKGHVDRSYEGIASRKCMVADDFTMPVYFLIPDGSGWFNLTRGQVLIFIDFRSLKVLGWSLQPDRNYSSLTIRSLCTHVFGEPDNGVPEVLQFERGIWESSKLLKGDKQAALEFSEVAQGLREFGIKFIHSIRPRSKTVERVGGLLQDLMEAEPGYCGRDERKDAPESLRKRMAAVQARKAGSLDHFYTFDQWNMRLGEIIEQYNSTRQQGRILDNICPDEAFAKFADPNDPPMELSGAIRYLLAHDKRPARVTLNGVTIQVGKKKFNYKGREIAHLVEKDVLAWFDPENPEILVVTDMNRENPICVARSTEPSALECLTDPQSETLARELKRVEEQASYMKTRFNVLKSKFPLPRRETFVNSKTLQLGTEIEEQKSRIKSEQAQGQKIRKLARNLNMSVPEGATRRPETAPALERLADFLNAED
jgi:hypothetical protein